MNTTLPYNRVSLKRETNYVAEENFNDLKSHFDIHSIEWMKSQNDICNSKPEKSNHFEFLWLSTGSGVLEADGQCRALTNSCIHCIFPGNTRKINLQPGSGGYYISFAIEFLKLSEGYLNSSAWLEQYYNHSAVASTTVEKEKHSEIEIILKQLMWEYGNYFNRRIELLKGLLNVFIIYFSRNLNKPEPTSHNREKELVNKFMGLMKKDYISNKMVNDYAGLLFVTPNYLNRIVKKNTGFTASYHIQQEIVIEAKRQALYSTKTMKQIAYELGFDNLAHFSKFFKNNCGMSFTEFKNTALRMQ